jgi:hypothetical protein
MRLATLLVLGCTACQRRDPAVHLQLLAGIDVSGSNLSHREEACQAVNSLVDSALPPRTMVTLWQFDSLPAIRYSEVPAGGAEDLADAEKSIRQMKSTTHGTYLSRLLQAQLATIQADTSAKDRFVLLVAADGDDEDPNATRAVARQLAQDSRIVAVWVAGVSDTDPGRLREHTNADFAPFGNRLVVNGRFDEEPAFARVRSLIKNAERMQR